MSWVWRSVGLGLLLLTAAITAPPTNSYAATYGPATTRPITVEVDARHPGAPIDPWLIGVNHVRAGTAPALRAIRTRSARTDVSFEAVVNGTPVYNCETGSWDPSFLDSQVALDRQAGAVPELIVDYTPPCLATNPPQHTNPNYSPPNLGANAAKMGHVGVQDGSSRDRRRGHTRLRGVERA